MKEEERRKEAFSSSSPALSSTSLLAQRQCPWGRSSPPQPVHPVQLPVQAITAHQTGIETLQMKMKVERQRRNMTRVLRTEDGGHTEVTAISLATTQGPTPLSLK
jgi:hypothetical protein